MKMATKSGIVSVRRTVCTHVRGWCCWLLVDIVVVVVVVMMTLAAQDTGIEAQATNPKQRWQRASTGMRSPLLLLDGTLVLNPCC